MKLSDYEVNPDGLVRSVRGPWESRKHWRWIRHPRERDPQQPRFAIGDSRWATDLAEFNRVLADSTDGQAVRIRNALTFVGTNGFVVQPSDIEDDNLRQAVIDFVRATLSQKTSDHLSGDFFTR